MKKTNNFIGTTDISFRLFSEQRQFQIISYGYDNCPPERAPSLFDKNIYSLHFILSGCGYLQYEGFEPIKLTSGQMFILLPHHKITYYADKNSPWSYYWIDFIGSHTIKLFENLQFSASTPSITPSNKTEMRKLFTENFTFSQQFPFYADIINQSYLCKILFILLKNFSSQNKDLFSPTNSNINNAQQYIEAHYSDPTLCLNNVAHACNLNKAYLSRIFVKSLGITFTSYITNLRIRKATTLFEQGKTSVKEVAYSVGFDSPYYFSNVFRKTIKISPSEYILQVKQKSSKMHYE